MPSIRIHGNTLADYDAIDLDELDMRDSESHRQRADLTKNLDARARSAELQAQRRSDRRKSATRGPRHNSDRR